MIDSMRDCNETYGEYMSRIWLWLSDRCLEGHPHRYFSVFRKDNIKVVLRCGS